MKKLILFIAAACCFKICYLQPGTLDSAFGKNGIVRTEFDGSGSPYGASGKQVLTQKNGTLYLVFETNLQTVITRILANGTIDTTYGNNGYTEAIGIRVGISYGVPAVLQNDGKVVIAGTSSSGLDEDFALARYNTNGTLDSTFSQDGVQITDVDGQFDVARSVAIQNDGKILVAGTALVRYNTDGTLDSTFSTDGKQLTDFFVFPVTLQSDGKIIIAGRGDQPVVNHTFVLARYNPDGTLDSAFAQNGKQTTDFSSGDDEAYSVAIQSDGKIVLAGVANKYSNSGTPDFALARYNADGTPDTTFSTDGKLTTDFEFGDDEANAVSIQSDGKIVAAGICNQSTLNSGSALARYNTDGTIDSTFSGDGKQITNFGSGYVEVRSMAVQSDGKIVVAGSSGIDFALARYNTNGNLDTTFSSAGIFIDRLHTGYTNYTTTAIQSDGKIVVAGTALARYNINGTLDSAFLRNVKKTTVLNGRALAIQNDGKIVVVGFSAALARYNVDGTLDTTFSGDGKVTTNYLASAVAIQRDGKIVVAGSIDKGDYFRFAVARYNTDGSFDVTFSADGKQETDFGFDSFANSVLIQNDGKIVIAGNAGEHAGFAFALARYNTDGTPDKSFSKDGKQITFLDSYYDQANSVAIQSDGKIVMAGVGLGNNDYDFTLVRYNTNGTLDSTFSGDGKLTTDFGVTSQANSVAIENDGKIVVAGIADQNFINSKFALARYNPNGSLDNTFGKAGKQITDVSAGSDVINDIAIFNNKLYAVGSAETPGSVGVVARYFLDNIKTPTVTLSMPYNIVKYTAPARIKLNATVTNEVAAIKKVRFYNGATLLHTETISPYGFLWDNVPLGNYNLTAKAYDAKGNVITSNKIEVSVVDFNVQPVVRIISPVADTTYTGPATIFLLAKAKDPNDKISKVEFYNGSVLLRTEYIYPYTYTWTSVQPGTYTVTAKAYDDKGVSTTSLPVTIIVTDATIVSSRAFHERKETGKLRLTLSPNPTHSSLHISADQLQQNKQTTIFIISASGVVLKTIQSNNSTKVIQLDVSSLTKGVYTIKIINGNKILYKQFLKL
ncbi:Ig-like domain-containing protein [Segetibacter koreensis]|uniref:Ig-like domain-containing protein n=1 Tax=Segetibacter koreensis TaxID=398037 RepID=UPI0003601938|nr:Ig-like domain-containing protein [Segetibacter koreensis]